MTAPLSGTALALLDALPEAALIVAPDGKIRYCNRVAADLLGYTPAEIVDPIQRVDGAAHLAEREGRIVGGAHAGPGASKP